MTRRDFQLIADVLKTERKRSQQYVAVNNPRTCFELDHLDQLTESFASVLAGTNSRFDRQRFIEACK